MPRFVLLLAAVLLSGCAGKPTTFLTLNEASTAQAFGVSGITVAVSRVDIPPSIDRTQFTTATGPATLHVAGDTRWAAPLSGMAQIVLARDLAARLPRADVLMPGDPVPAGGVVQLRVNIQTFIADSAGLVTLDADWSITAPQGQIVKQGRFNLALQGSVQPGAEAETMSALLGRLADTIAQRLSA